MSFLLLLGVLAWAAYSQWGRLSGYYDQLTGTVPPDDKQRQVHQILAQMREYAITLSDLAQAEKMSSAESSHTPKNASDIAMKIFSWLGGIFILAGIGVYISMFWDTMPSLMRIFITLGVGLSLSVLSVIAMHEGKYPRFIMPLIFIAAGIETSGWFVFIHEVFPHGDNIHKAAAAVFGLMALQQGAVFYRFPRTDLAFTALVFAYGFLGNALDVLGIDDKYIAMILGGSMIYTAWAIEQTRHRMLSVLGYVVGAVWFNIGLYEHIEYITREYIAAMVTGLSFCCFAYGLRERGARKLPGIGFLMGSALFYEGLFDGLRHTPFELLYLAVSVAMLYGAALLASRAILFTTVIAILGFIGYYSSEYFAGSVGWPVALILMGIAFFAVGAWAIKIKRRYQL